MKKIFLAIYFMVIIGVGEVRASVIETAQIDNVPHAQTSLDTQVSGMPDPDNQEEVIAFFRERFRTAQVSSLDDLGEINKPDSMDIQHSSEYIEQMQKENKSTFEKIYDEAMGRITNASQDTEDSTETIFYEMVSDKIQNEFQSPNQLNIPVVNVTLPTGNKIIAPAREHIPYMLSSYNILPSGLIQVQEDITVVANGKKLKNGLIKVLNKYSVSRANVRKKLDVQLLSVTLNNQPIAYRLEEIGDKIYMKPQEAYSLQPGVYTFSFKYLLDRKLWYYDDFSEFYVDVTGSYLNLVITSANAIVSVPDGRNFMSQTAFIGSPGRYSVRRSVIASLASNALGFASVTPLLPGEGMHLLVSLDKNVFIEPDMNRRFAWFITDYGDVLFALAGLAAILISYLLSWHYLKKNKKLSKSSAGKTATVIRYMQIGKFDNRAFVAALLELVKKDIIDIRTQDNSILVVKKTDDVRHLSRGEKNIIKHLFPSSEPVLTVGSLQALKFKRAIKAMEKDTKLSTKLMSLKTNIGYLLFSIAMLLLSEIAIAQLAVNPLQTGFILFSSTLTIAFYLWVLKRRFKNKWVMWAIKTLAVLFIIFAVLFMSVYVKLIAALLIVCMVYCIFEFDELFTKRSGLLKSKAKEYEDLKKYLIDNVQSIGRTMAFSNYQAYIYAMELENCYAKNEYNEQWYKLDLAERIAQIL